MADAMPEPRRARGQTITVAQAAALLGRSERWVQGLVKAGHMERATRGEYTLVGVIPPCQGCCRWVSEVDDGLRRAEDRTDGGVLKRAEGIGDREDAFTP